jgi:hypothetical protein
MLEKVLKANASSEVNLAPTRRITRCITHRMITDMPRRAALDTTEILENVLSFLTPVSLFGLQRVSRQWRDLIGSSPLLKEKMFLRVSPRTPDIWRFINPKPYPTIDWHRDMLPGLPYFAGQGFRNASVTEVESRAWSTSPGETQHLYTPVSLNPFLFTADYFDCKWIEGTWFFRATLKPETEFTQQSTLRDTHLTNLLSTECCAIMKFDARKSSLVLDRIWCQAVIRSNKPLTLGDVIDQTLASHMWETLNEKGQRVGPVSNFPDRLGRVPRDISLSEKIAELDKQHGCKTVFQPHRGMHVVIALKEQTYLPLVLTDAEYLQYKPAESSSQ